MDWTMTNNGRAYFGCIMAWIENSMLSIRWRIHVAYKIFNSISSIVPCAITLPLSTISIHLVRFFSIFRFCCTLNSIVPRTYFNRFLYFVHTHQCRMPNFNWGIRFISELPFILFVAIHCVIEISTKCTYLFFRFLLLSLLTNDVIDKKIHRTTNDQRKAER